MLASDNMLVRFKLTRVMDDLSYQRVQGAGRKNEVWGKGEYGPMRVQNYGFTANAPIGSVGLAQPMLGNPDEGMITNLEHPDYRPRNLAEGDVMFYSKHNAGAGADRSDYIKFSADELKISHAKKIILQVGETKLIITDGHVNIVGAKTHLVKTGDNTGTLEATVTAEDEDATFTYVETPGRGSVNFTPV